MDYWEQLKVERHVNYEAFLTWYRENVPEGTLWFTTTKAEKTYAAAHYAADDALVFGAESAGIPEEILVTDKAHCIRIPMLQEARSLNLSNAVSVVLYEALRQQNFEGLQTEGALHRLAWEE